MGHLAPIRSELSLFRSFQTKKRMAKYYAAAKESSIQNREGWWGKIPISF